LIKIIDRQSYELLGTTPWHEHVSFDDDVTKKPSNPTP